MNLKRAIFAVALVLIVSVGWLYRWQHHLDDMIDIQWNSQTRVLDWGRGAVVVPAGFDYEPLSGIDSAMGRFVTHGGKFAIEFDIGELAGEHGGHGAVESDYRGSRVFYGTITDIEGVYAKTSYPDNGCANFYATSNGDLDLATFDELTRSFTPHNRLPAWVLRLLPNPLRSECRWRTWF